MSWVVVPMRGNVMTQSRLGQLEEFTQKRLLPPRALGFGGVLFGTRTLPVWRIGLDRVQWNATIQTCDFPLVLPERPFSEEP